MERWLQEKYSVNGELQSRVIAPMSCMYIGLYVWVLLSTRRQGLTPDQEVFEKHIADLSGKLDVYDKILSKQKYLLGDVR